MWEIKDEIWEKQIGLDITVSEDFSGREIHYNDFQNYNSPFGWNLISFGDDEYLIVNVKTESEFPRNILDNPDEEFLVNGKLFNMTRNKFGEWDVNLVEYDEEFIPGQPKNNSYESNNNNQYNNINNSYETQAFSFNNYENDREEQIRQQQNQIEELQRQLAYEQTQQLELERSQELLRKRNSEMLAQEQLRQKKEIELLENQLRLQKEQTQQIEIERNNKRLNELRNQIARTQAINSSALENFKIEENVAKTLGTTSTISSGFNQFSNSSLTNSFNRTMINDLSKKLDEQTMQIKSLRMDQKNNAKKLDDIEKRKQEIQTRENIMAQESRQAVKLWEIKFGNNSFGTDFAGRVISKDKFGQNSEGGWNIDYYSPNSMEPFIASTKTIRERAGKQAFSIEDKSYFILNNSGKWEIEQVKKGQKFEYSSKNITNIASNFKPEENTFNGNYESYSSLLINLNHFPLIHLDKFDQFLKQTLSNMSFFKELFVYSNERLYKKNESNISAYARIFFKTQSTKDEIEVLLASLSLKKGMMRFIGNFKETNRVDNISFSMVLMNHQKRLKFVHAQTNFELLRAHPIPLKIPLERLILDREYNSILKFHENNLWRQLKPFALDWNGNTYYVCDIDIDQLDISFAN
ncbi:hypothetical protein ACJA28_01375 [Mesomycoplasma moatsii]|uniref:hypothetical protein n=1 Tax=Mesomycoplasma moatsii TaxID=171287 RepID=UPI0003B637EE